VDALVAQLSAQEDGNFRLFNYVAEVNADAEELAARMRDLQVGSYSRNSPLLPLFHPFFASPCVNLHARK
jgi:hypothetical protein